MALKFKKPTPATDTAPADPVPADTAPATVAPMPAATPADLAAMKPMTVQPLVKEPVAAQILGLSVQYLSRDRWYANKEGIAPKVPYVKVAGGAVRYAVSDLMAVIEASRVS